MACNRVAPAPRGSAALQASSTRFQLPLQHEVEDGEVRCVMIRVLLDSDSAFEPVDVS